LATNRSCGLSVTSFVDGAIEKSNVGAALEVRLRR
jgi:hypothetical protein